MSNQSRDEFESFVSGDGGALRLDADLLQKVKISIRGYRLLGVIGNGGQATVYKAIEESGEKNVVAIKIPHLGPFAISRARRLLEREHRTMQSLCDVPNICRSLSIGETDEGYVYLAMQYINGKKLSTLWEQDQDADQPEVQRKRVLLFHRICETIAPIHRYGLTHRDLKASNILIDPAGEPYILDFGLARTIFDEINKNSGSRGNTTCFFAGTIEYASPEQISKASKVDIRSDVYALGVILYQMLTNGCFPHDFDGHLSDDFRMGDFKMIVEGVPISPSDRLTGGDRRQMFSRSSQIDPPLEAIVMKAIAKDPAQRYQSAGELAVEIDDYLQGRPVRALLDRGEAKDVSRHSALWRRGLKISGGIGAGLFVLAMLLIHDRLPLRPLARSTASASALPAAGNSSPNVQWPTPLVFTRNAAGLETFSNSLKMQFVIVPPGTFMMGSTVADPDRKPDEVLHRVTLRRKFAMAADLVTRGEFSRFIRESGYQSIVELSGDAHDRLSNTDMPQRNWHNPGFAQTDDDPVAAISWYDAKAFCEWLSKKESRHYRLPTEAEYEYACRAGSQTIYFMGNNPPDFADYSWYNVNSFSGTHPVGQNKPNPWGLYDMCGNLLTWCEDWFEPQLSGDAIDPTGPATGMTKSLRGGTWGRSQFQCRCANRTQSLPDRTNNVWGMRLVMDLP